MSVKTFCNGCGRTLAEDEVQIVEAIDRLSPWELLEARRPVRTSRAELCGPCALLVHEFLSSEVQDPKLLAAA